MAANPFQAMVITQYGGSGYKRAKTIEDAEIKCQQQIAELARWKQPSYPGMPKPTAESKPRVVRCEIRTNTGEVIKAWEV